MSRTNLDQDFLTADGEKPSRNRDDEFDSFGSRGELIEYWEAGWQCLFGTLDSLSPSDLGRTVLIRGEPHSVPIQRSLTQCGYPCRPNHSHCPNSGGRNWKTITIPRGASATFNQRVWGSGSYQKAADHHEPK
jgi:hypothetical protein